MPEVKSPKIKFCPIGIEPKFIWELKRLENLKQAIYRYISEGFNVSVEWTTEYNELLNKLKEEGRI